VHVSVCVFSVTVHLQKGNDYLKENVVKSRKASSGSV